VSRLSGITSRCTWRRACQRRRYWGGTSALEASTWPPTRCRRIELKSIIVIFRFTTDVTIEKHTRDRDAELLRWIDNGMDICNRGNSTRRILLKESFVVLDTRIYHRNYRKARRESRRCAGINNAYRTTWGWPATRLDGDERPSDKKRDDPSPRVHGFPSRRTRCKRGSNARRRCWPPSKRCRSQSKFRGISTLETKAIGCCTERWYMWDQWDVGCAIVGRRH